MRKIQIYTAFIAVVVLTSLMWYGCAKDEEEETLGTIYGTVTDFATGDPISNVNVKLLPSGVTTLTGSDGIYEFRELKADRYSLLFSKAEYSDLEDDYVILLEEGKSVRRDVQMRKKIASLIITNMQGESIQTLDFGMEESVTSKSFNIFNNGTVNIECHLSYNCAWIDTAMAVGTTITPGQTLTVTIVIDRTKLLPGENRTYLHIISNNGGNDLEITATGYGTPVVSTGSVSNITATSASCSGNVTTDGGTSVINRGICWGTSNVPTIENSSYVGNGTGTGSFTSTMSNLTPNTVYYVRAYATNARGTSYGEQKQFTTQNGQPTVSINAVSNITATSAVCGGSISSNGGFSITGKGLVWSTAQYPTLNDYQLSLGSGDAPFTGSMTNLSLGTTYYVRAYATNSQGTAYSEQRSFTTGSGLPTVTTTNASLSGGNVVSGGNVSSDGGYPVTARGICYGVYPNPDLTSAYTHTTDGSGTGYFSSVIDASGGNILYVRAYATNANGTAYGNQKTVNLDYLALPTFSFNGHTYRVAPDPHTQYTEYIGLESAYIYCENLTAYGYSDWRMPTIDELETMYQNRASIGGFIESNGDNYSYYYSSTAYDNTYYYSVNWTNGSLNTEAWLNFSGYSRLGGYPITYKRFHVRPIRIEN